MRPKRPAVSFDPPSTREAINANTQLSQAIQDSAANCSFVRFMDSTLRDGVVSNLRTIDGEIAGRKQRSGYRVFDQKRAVINSLKFIMIQKALRL